VTLAELNAGALVYTPATGTPPPSTTITFIVKDDGGTAAITGSSGISVSGVDTDSIPKVLNITVSTVPNTPPVGTPNTVKTNEDTNYVFKASDFTYLDAENNGLFSVTVGSPLPQKGVLTLNGVPVAASQKVSVSDINNGRLVFAPLPLNGVGTDFATLLFEVQDDGGTAAGGLDTDSVFRPLTITVNAVNDPATGQDRTVSTKETRGLRLPGD